MRSRFLIVWVCGAMGGTASIAHAQTCTPSDTPCGDGTCCPLADVCCPGAGAGCCGAEAPYCCGDGTCAVTPSDCASTDEGCAQYAIPCGGGCILAGDDCCDQEGHFCTATETCLSATTCSSGDASVTAFQVAPAAAHPSSNPTSPLEEPANATGRSCAASVGPRSSNVPIFLSAMLALVVCRRRASRCRRGAAAPPVAILDTTASRPSGGPLSEG